MFLRTLLQFKRTSMGRIVSSRALYLLRPSLYPHKSACLIEGNIYSDQKGPYVATFWNLEEYRVPKDKSLTDLVSKIRETYDSQEIEYGFFCFLDTTKQNERTMQELSDAKVTVVHTSNERASKAVYRSFTDFCWKVSKSSKQLSVTILTGCDSIFRLLSLTSDVYKLKTTWIYPKFCRKDGTSFPNHCVSIEKLAKGIPNRYQEKETIQVDFDVRIPDQTFQRSDFQVVSNLLYVLFLGEHISTFELADLLIQQRKITGVIKSWYPGRTPQHLRPLERYCYQQVDDDDIEDDNEDEVNGIFSVVNLTEKSIVNCVNEIKTCLLSHCKEASSDEEFQTFQRILDDKRKHVGFIISERMLKVPPKIAVPLYSGLSFDMAKAKSKGEPFDFEYFVLICKIVVVNEGKPQENVVYENKEEELIAEVATFSFDFSVAAEFKRYCGNKSSAYVRGSTDRSMKGHRKRRVLVLPASQWGTMYNKLAQVFGR